MTGSRDGDLLKRIGRLEDEVKELNAIKNMGKGALWIVFKVGVVVGTIAGIVVAIWGAVKGGP